jgi:hypothetical protein
MVTTTDADYRAANRRVANVAACQASAAAETAERDRKNAAVVVNAPLLLRMTASARS